jgi:hypothetical protein
VRPRTTSRPSPPPELLPVSRVSDLDDTSAEQRWLVESLWAKAGVGIVGGAPKSCKSWLGLDLALSVATATPCLGQYAVRDAGPVLLYLAEDAPGAFKQRLLSLARARGVTLDAAPLHVITAAALRLDVERDQQRLDATLSTLRPRLLLLDPFVRLHRIDENSAAEVSALLAFLRELQRQHDVAIVVVHHTRKAGGGLGQALRGSGDFHAWTDSALYVRRQQARLVVSAEHRAAPSPEPFPISLAQRDDGSAYLELPTACAVPDAPDASTADRLLAAITAAGGVATREQLRAALHLRNERLGTLLAELEQRGTLQRGPRGWQTRSIPVPA